MKPPPFDIELHVDRHGASLRRLARTLAQDPDAAADAVQETWLQALRSPPREQNGIGAWLAAVLRNVRRRTRRSDARRRQHEAAAARTDAVGDPAAVLAREEIAQRLLAAVAALAQPYRDAIWARFFDGMAPREIAAQSGVPVATIKSRVQRGLTQLREQLGDDGGPSWRPALLGAFGLQGATTAATVGSGVYGGALMVAWWKLTAAAVAVAMVALVLWPRPTAAIPPTDIAQLASETATAAAAANRATHSNAAAVLAQPIQRTQAASPIAGRDPRMARIVGRCVDPNGVPLTGCIATVTGTARSEQVMQRWLADHEQPAPVNVASPETGSDGTFTLELLPSPPLQFNVSVQRPKCASAGGWFQDLVEGGLVDCGDVVMEPGVLVQGRVIDAHGLPVGDVQIDARNPDQQASRTNLLAAGRYRAARTRSDGSFSFVQLLPIGSYQLRVNSHYTMQSPQTLQLSSLRAVEDIVVTVTLPSGAATLSGWVRDERGEPVANATVQVRGQELTATSRRDGSFQLVGPHTDEHERVALAVAADGFEAAPDLAGIAWGRQDIECTLQRAAVLMVEVVDEASLPVLDYTVRCLPVAGTGHTMVGSQDTQVRAHGPFVDGIASVPGVGSGEWLLVVEFPRESQLLRVIQKIVRTPSSGVRQLVRAQRACERILGVEYGDGSPVTGTRVQLCEMFGHTFDANTMVFDFAMWLNNWHVRSGVMVMFDAVTDAAGRVTLAGPAQQVLGLRVLGPGHVMKQECGVSLDQPGDLVVRVARGARLVGEITPPEAMTELRRLSVWRPETVPGTFAPNSRPTLRLLSDDGRSVPSMRDTLPTRGQSNLVIGEDGHFACDGLPSGSWTLQVEYLKMLAPGASTRARLSVATIVLHDEAETTAQIDLSALLTGELVGEVWRNGEPLRNTDVALQPIYATGVQGKRRQDWIGITTDEDGGFRYQGRAGEYSLQQPQAGPDGRPLPGLVADSTTTVVCGEATRHRFAIRSGTWCARVLDAAGKAQVGIVLQIDGWAMPPTDQQGMVRIERTAGTSTLQVLPKSLQSREAQLQLLGREPQGDANDPLARHRIDLGQATVLAGQTTTIDLSLPPEWDR